MGIFVDAKGVNCKSLKIVYEKKYLTQNFFEAIADRSCRRKLYYVLEFILHRVRKQSMNQSI